MKPPVWGPALGALVCLGACMVDDETVIESEATCGDPSAYNPFLTTAHTATASATPWSDNFDSYQAPQSIECSSTKSSLANLDVTAGCLTAALVSTYHRAAVTLTSAGAFRVVALPHQNNELVKWTDQHNEFRVYVGGTTDGAMPGVKAFVRYRSEDDLYVASWRFDGVVQIQRKQCGVYTTLVHTNLPPPTLRAWHRMRFDAVGENLALYLDDKLVLTTQASAFSWGTAGIRLDGVTGTYLDDWRVF